jgi:hypothetical protein
LGANGRYHEPDGHYQEAATPSSYLPQFKE